MAEKESWPTIEQKLLTALREWIEARRPNLDPKWTPEVAFRNMAIHAGMQDVLTKLTAVGMSQTREAAHNAEAVMQVGTADVK